MSDDERALVAAIQAAPDDDTPRLVYADWLDEFGHTDQHRARSEWVRMTCDDRSKRAQKPTGRRVRRPGECAWLEKNWDRLWPNVHAALTAFGDSAYTRTALVTGGLVFRVPVRVRSELTETPYTDSSQIVLRAERGVATRAYVPCGACGRERVIVVPITPSLRAKLAKRRCKSCTHRRAV